MGTPMQHAPPFLTVTPPPSRRNLVVEAGAGTGKTSAIVAEVLELLLGDENLAPERIVLMTFTEKAAGEIADRIHAALAELELHFDDEQVSWPVGSGTPLFKVPDGKREAFRSACQRQLARIDSIRSQTIHSFCQSILRSYPIEAGLDPQFKIVEGFERGDQAGEELQRRVALVAADPGHGRALGQRVQRLCQRGGLAEAGGGRDQDQRALRQSLRQALLQGRARQHRAGPRAPLDIRVRACRRGGGRSIGAEAGPLVNRAGRSRVEGPAGGARRDPRSASLRAFGRSGNGAGEGKAIVRSGA